MTNCREIHVEILLLLVLFGYVNSVNVVGITGFDIELKCSKSSQQILWFKGDVGLSEITTIYEKVRPIEFRDRLSITGNHANGEYHLTIATVKKTDVGIYGCAVLGVPEQSSMNLTVVDGPSNVNLDKTQNKLVGTEDQDLIITCTAVSEDPSPDMVLQIKNQNFTRSGTKIIQHTIQRVDRTYDGSTVTCLVGYQRYNYFNVNDSALIYLRLIPSTPTFSPDSVVGENTKPLVVTCTSTGGRPEPTERQWKIDNTDVTSYSDISSSHISASDTYTVTSTLTYSVTRHDNGKTLSCGFKNYAVNSYISTRVMNIRYAPSLSVDNKTFIFNNSPRQLTCVADGNPSQYTFSKWQHNSKYGTFIRYLDGNNILILPEVSEEIRYQDTGEYVCTVSNGIVGADGNVNQKSSGYVTSKAPPVFLKRDILTGQTKKDVNLVVDVYSEPKYTSLTWMTDTSPITSSVKYNMTEVPAVVTDVFHGTEVQVDGYQISLTINELEDNDFVNYTLKLGNGVGRQVDLVIYLSASPPDMPKNFTLVGATDSTVTLQWLPAFNGGSEQTFIIEYRIAGTVEWKNTTIPKTLQGPNDELQTYSLSGLTDSTHYEIRMYAKNKFNRSSTTDVVRVSTTENPGNGAVIGAVVGALLGVGVIVAIVAVVVIRRRRDGSGTQKKLSSESESEDDGLKDNILYKSVEMTSKPQEACEYAEVQKPNDVYAEVKKPDHQKKAKEKKQKATKSPAKKKQNSKVATNNNSDAETYANQSDYANAENPTASGYKNADGLQYADLSFSNPPKSKSGKPVIHGLEERTIYCDVDLTKKAPPLPQEGAYELTDIGKGNQS